MFLSHLKPCSAEVGGFVESSFSLGCRRRHAAPIKLPVSTVLEAVISFCCVLAHYFLIQTELSDRLEVCYYLLENGW